VALEWEQTLIDAADPVVLADLEGNEFCVLSSRSS
jgi:hypothetical protein